MNERGEGTEPSETFEVEAEFALVGRTFEEYRAFFGLGPDDLTGRRVLDCPSGVGSFVATARRRGVDVVGADPAYARPADELARRARADWRRVVDQVDRKRELFDWSFYGDVEGRRRRLRAAPETFLADYRSSPTGDGGTGAPAERASPTSGRPGGARYVVGALPTLPFPDDAFDLVLSAHLLFLYGDRLDHGFHLAALRELARVAREEVRVFPLVGLNTEPYPRLDDALTDLQAAGHGVERRPVPFEFQKGATEALVVDVE